MQGKHFKVQESDDAEKLDRKELIIVVAIGCACALLRILLAANTPMVPWMQEAYDDLMLVRYAQTMQAGDWLGAYNSFTLAKNPGYAFFLLLPGMTGLSYQVLFALFFVASCAAFVLAIRPLVPSRKMRLAIFVGFLFLPPLFTSEMFQRVYRMGIVIPFVIAIFSSYIALYARRDEPVLRLLPWGICAAVSLAWFSYIKEDAIWVMPFVWTVTAILAIFWLVRTIGRHMRVPDLFFHVLILVLPFALTAGVGQAIRHQNEVSYGVATTCERSDTGFTAFAARITSIKTDDTNADVWVSPESIELAISNSPTFATIADEIRASYAAWGGGGPVRGDIAHWALRGGYEEAGGYKDGRTTNEFWQKAADELDAAFAAGKLTKKPGLKISATVTPLTMQELPRLARRCAKNTLAILSLRHATVNIGHGNGELEDQEVAAALIKGPTTLSTATYPLPMPQRVALKASGIILNVEKFLAVPLALACVAATVVLIFVSFARGYVEGRHVLLILLGLVLSCVALIVAVSWDMLFQEAHSDALIEWASYMYCAACYPLFYMGGALTLGSLARYFIRRKSQEGMSVE